MTEKLKLEWLDLREDLLFQSNARNFADKASRYLAMYASELATAAPERRREVAEMLGELAVDMRSFITHWHLKAKNNRYRVSDAETDRQAKAIHELLEAAGFGEVAVKSQKAAEKMLSSNLYDISVKTERGELNNYIGNDAYYGLTDSMRRGCALVTTNPVMVNSACREAGEKYKPIRGRIKKNHPRATAAELVTWMTTEVVYENCYELYPVYRATGGENGYVSLQVNPHNANNADAMFAEVNFIYGEIEARLGGKPNLVFKIPGTAAALDTVARMTARGIGVNITASCSVAQHLSLGAVIERGNAQFSFVTMMSGRFDDRVADELKELGYADGAEIARHASGLVIERSYDILYRKMGCRKSHLLAASMRGPWNVEAALANGPSSIFISLFPPNGEEYDQVKRSNRSTMGDAPEPRVMEALNKSKIFREGYLPEAMQPEDYYNFFPVSVTLGSFCAKYDDTVKFMLADD